VEVVGLLGSDNTMSSRHQTELKGIFCVVGLVGNMIFLCTGSVVKT
jgi:alkyl hydroperoxide reductase subunit AhpF